MAALAAGAEAAVAAQAAAAVEAVVLSDHEVSFGSIGFMPLKKLLMERGVPKDAVFSAANKVALKEIAAKYQTNITFVD